MDLGLAEGAGTRPVLPLGMVGAYPSSGSPGPALAGAWEGGKLARVNLAAPVADLAAPVAGR